MNELLTIDTEELATQLREKQYEPLQLVPETDPILYKKSEPFVFNSGENPLELAGRLKATLKATRAYGVAAPQCGISSRVIVIGTEDQYYTMFNPEIVEISEKTVAMEEGCLSFPFLVLSVVRPQAVVVAYLDEQGTKKNLTLDGLSARIFLHEYDHIEGVTFNKIAKPLALKMGLKKREKQMKRFARQLVLQRKIENEKPR